jgi:hypothetical protein
VKRSAFARQSGALSFVHFFGRAKKWTRRLGGGGKMQGCQSKDSRAGAEPAFKPGMNADKYVLFEQLHGTQLSSVEFVHDYLQLRFDGPTINVMNPMLVVSGFVQVRTGDDQFRNALCAQIPKIVRKVSVIDEHELMIEFDDSSRISISLKQADYSDPEAVYYHGFKDDEWGVI